MSFASSLLSGGQTEKSHYSQLLYLRPNVGGSLLFPISYLINFFIWVLLNLFTGWSHGFSVVVLVSTLVTWLFFARRFRFRLTQTQYETTLPGINFAREEEGNSYRCDEHCWAQ
jgi:hypothetical protein